MTKRKLAKLQKLEEEKALKEATARMNIRRTLSSMKSQSKKLDRFKEDYITKARTALQVNDATSYKLAKSGLKLCLSKQRYLDSMIANFEISMQINDMNKIIGEFVEGINVISEQMREITSTLDLTKAQEAYDRALANNQTQYEALDTFLETAADSIQSFDELDTNIGDDELDALISQKAADAESSKEREVEEKISSMKDKILND